MNHWSPHTSGLSLKATACSAKAGGENWAKHYVFPGKAPQGEQQPQDQLLSCTTPYQIFFTQGFT